MTPSRADVAQKQKRRRPVIPAFPFVGTTCLLANRMKPFFPNQRLNAPIVRPRLNPDLKPPRQPGHPRLSPCHLYVFTHSLTTSASQLPRPLRERAGVRGIASFPLLCKEGRGEVEAFAFLHSPLLSFPTLVPDPIGDLIGNPEICHSEQSEESAFYRCSLLKRRESIPPFVIMKDRGRIFKKRAAAPTGRVGRVSVA